MISLEPQQPVSKKTVNLIQEWIQTEETFAEGNLKLAKQLREIKPFSADQQLGIERIAQLSQAIGTASQSLFENWKGVEISDNNSAKFIQWLSGCLDANTQDGKFFINELAGIFQATVEHQANSEFLKQIKVEGKKTKNKKAPNAGVKLDGNTIKLLNDCLILPVQRLGRIEMLMSQLLVEAFKPEGWHNQVILEKIIVTILRINAVLNNILRQIPVQYHPYINYHKIAQEVVGNKFFPKNMDDFYQNYLTEPARYQKSDFSDLTNKTKQDTENPLVQAIKQNTKGDVILEQQVAKDVLLSFILSLREIIQKYQKQRETNNRNNSNNKNNQLATQALSYLEQLEFDYYLFGNQGSADTGDFYFEKLQELQQVAINVKDQANRNHSFKAKIIYQRVSTLSTAIDKATELQILKTKIVSLEREIESKKKKLQSRQKKHPQPKEKIVNKNEQLQARIQSAKLPDDIKAILTQQTEEYGEIILQKIESIERLYSACEKLALGDAEHRLPDKSIIEAILQGKSLPGTFDQFTKQYLQQYTKNPNFQPLDSENKEATIGAKDKKEFLKKFSSFYVKSRSYKNQIQQKTIDCFSDALEQIVLNYLERRTSEKNKNSLNNQLAEQMLQYIREYNVERALYSLANNGQSNDHAVLKKLINLAYYVEQQADKNHSKKSQKKSSLSSAIHKLIHNFEATAEITALEITAEALEAENQALQQQLDGENFPPEPDQATPMLVHALQAIDCVFSDKDQRPTLSLSGGTLNMTNQMPGEEPEAYIARKKTQIKEIIAFLKAGNEKDFLFLQEIDFLVEQDEFYQKIKDYFVRKLGEAGFDYCMSPVSALVSQKPLAVIYHREKIEPVLIKETKPQKIGDDFSDKEFSEKLENSEEVEVIHPYTDDESGEETGGSKTVFRQSRRLSLGETETAFATGQAGGRALFLDHSDDRYYGYEWTFRTKATSPVTFALTNIHLGVGESTDADNSHSTQIKNYLDGQIQQNIPTIVGGDTHHPIKHFADATTRQVYALGDSTKATAMVVDSEESDSDEATADHSQGEHTANHTLLESHDNFFVSPSRNGYVSVGITTQYFIKDPEAKNKATSCHYSALGQPCQNAFFMPADQDQQAFYLRQKRLFTLLVAEVQALVEQELVEQELVEQQEHPNQHVFQDLIKTAHALLSHIENDLYAEQDPARQAILFQQYGGYLKKVNAVLSIAKNSALSEEKQTEKIETANQRLINYTVRTFASERHKLKMFLGISFSIIAIAATVVGLTLLSGMTLGLPAVAAAAVFGAVALGGSLGIVSGAWTFLSGMRKQLSGVFKLQYGQGILAPQSQSILAPVLYGRDKKDHKSIEITQVTVQKNIDTIDIHNRNEMFTFSSNCLGSIAPIKPVGVDNVLEGGKWILRFNELPDREWEIIKKLLSEGLIFNGEFLYPDKAQEVDFYAITLKVENANDKAMVMRLYDIIIMSGLNQRAINKDEMEFKTDQTTTTHGSVAQGIIHNPLTLETLAKEAFEQRRHNLAKPEPIHRV